MNAALGSTENGQTTARFPPQIRRHKSVFR
jgi:hypothetical protein